MVLRQNCCSSRNSEIGLIQGSLASARVNNSANSPVCHFRYLGVEFDDVIGWKFQVDLTVRKVSKKIDLLRR